jgi:ribulose-phosphate 3-epimerase
MARPTADGFPKYAAKPVVVRKENCWAARVVASLVRANVARACMCAEGVLHELHAAVPVIGPSLLASDFGHLANEIHRLEAAGVKLLHLDIMDGHFVPNLSFGFPVLAAIRRETRLPLDVHLMISDPDRYVERFRAAGADLITFHIEAVPEPRPLLQKIRSLGAAAGLSLNPTTPVETLRPWLADSDLVLVMSVMPGFGGQSFQPEALSRLQQLRSMAGPHLLLSVDGGINAEDIGACAEAGADIFIAGEAFFSQHRYGQTLEEFTALAKSYKTLQV